jgi:ribosomal protein S18 acetylase RimI-like enzyme
MSESRSPNADEDDIEEARRLVYDFEPQASMKLSSGGYVSFRPFQDSDREQVQGRHEEWFPVRYQQEFYDDLVHHRMFNSGEQLFTYAVIYHDDNEAHSDVQSCSSWCSSSHDSIANEDFIVACVVGTFLNVSSMDNTTSSLLVSNPSRYTRLFYIMTLGTVTEFRHSRLATTLIEKCIEIVENDSQCGALYLHVITFNTAAIRFYERLGFYRVKEIEGKSNLGGIHNAFWKANSFFGSRLLQN